MKNIDRKKYIDKLEKLQDTGDIEVQHEESDSILCEILNKLGYEDIVDAYVGVEKWFA